MVVFSLLFLAGCLSTVMSPANVADTISVLGESYRVGDIESIVQLHTDPFNRSTAMDVTHADLLEELSAFYTEYAYTVYTVDDIQVEELAPNIALCTFNIQSVAEGATSTIAAHKKVQLTLQYMGRWQIIGENIISIDEIIEEEHKRPALQLNVQLVGSDSFKGKVTESMELLYEQSYEHFALVNGTLSKIQAGQRSGAEVWTRTFVIGPSSQNTDVYWLASIIVHDTVHVVQYLEQRTYFGKEAELEALRVQLACLQALNAPEYHISRIQQILDDPDNNNYWDVDYNDRNW